MILNTTRLYPLAPVSFQISECQVSANRFEVISHCLRHRSLIKGTAALGCKRGECSRQIRISENVTRLGCHVAGKVGFCRVCLLFNHGCNRFKPLPVTFKPRRDHWTEWKTVARVLDRRCQNVAHWQTTPSFMQCKPPIHSARHGNRQRAVGWDAHIILGNSALGFHRRDGLSELIEGTTHWCAPRPVVSIQLLGFRIPHNREQISTDTVACRLHQPQGCVRRYRCINRRTAGLKHINRNVRCQGLCGSGHAIDRHNGAS